QAYAVLARLSARLGQQIGALINLARELGPALVRQIWRQIVGQPVAADLLLGQVAQHLTQQQQADAQVRRALGPPTIARPQASPAEDTNCYAKPDHKPSTTR